MEPLSVVILLTAVFTSRVDAQSNFIDFKDNFTMDFRLTHWTDCDMTLSHILPGSIINITSPLYPLAIPHDGIRCEWLVKGKSPSYFQVKFLDIDLPVQSLNGVCNVAYLEYGGFSKRGVKVLKGKACGRSIPMEFVTDTSWAWANFVVNKIPEKAAERFRGISLQMTLVKINMKGFQTAVGVCFVFLPLFFCCIPFLICRKNAERHRKSSRSKDVTLRRLQEKLDVDAIVIKYSLQSYRRTNNTQRRVPMSEKMKRRFSRLRESLSLEPMKRKRVGSLASLQQVLPWRRSRSLGHIHQAPPQDDREISYPDMFKGSSAPCLDQVTNETFERSGSQPSDSLLKPNDHSRMRRACHLTKGAVSPSTYLSFGFVSEDDNIEDTSNRSLRGQLAAVAAVSPENGSLSALTKRINRHVLPWKHDRCEFIQEIVYPSPVSLPRRFSSKRHSLPILGMGGKNAMNRKIALPEQRQAPVVVVTCEASCKMETSVEKTESEAGNLLRSPLSLPRSQSCPSFSDSMSSVLPSSEQSEHQNTANGKLEKTCSLSSFVSQGTVLHNMTVASTVTLEAYSPERSLEVRDTPLNQTQQISEESNAEVSEGEMLHDSRDEVFHESSLVKEPKTKPLNQTYELDVPSVSSEQWEMSFSETKGRYSLAGDCNMSASTSGPSPVLALEKMINTAHDSLCNPASLNTPEPMARFNYATLPTPHNAPHSPMQDLGCSILTGSHIGEATDKKDRNPYYPRATQLSNFNTGYHQCHRSCTSDLYSDSRSSYISNVPQEQSEYSQCQIPKVLRLKRKEFQPIISPRQIQTSLGCTTDQAALALNASPTPPRPPSPQLLNLKGLAEEEIRCHGSVLGSGIKHIPSSPDLKRQRPQRLQDKMLRPELRKSKVLRSPEYYMKKRSHAQPLTPSKPSDSSDSTGSPINVTRSRKSVRSKIPVLTPSRCSVDLSTAC